MIEDPQLIRCHRPMRDSERIHLDSNLERLIIGRITGAQPPPEQDTTVDRFHMLFADCRDYLWLLKRASQMVGELHCLALATRAAQDLPYRKLVHQGCDMAFAEQ